MKRQFKSLTWKQTMLVITTALFFAIAIFLIEIIFVAVDARRSLIKEQSELLDSIEEPIANAVWVLDDDLAKQIINGILKVPHIQSSKIELEDGELFVSASNPTGERTFFIGLSDKLFGDLAELSQPISPPTYVQRTHKDVIIGTVYFTFDIQALTHDLFVQLQLSLWATLAGALLLTLVLSLVFHSFLTKPIAQISEYIDKIDPERPDNHLLSSSSEHANDELGLVIAKLNQILIQFGQTQNKLKKLATRDLLTSLPNRVLMLENIAIAIQNSKTEQKKFCLFFIDLDRFKNVNDSLGHALGDLFLTRIAKTLLKAVDNKACVARIGGDEFAILALNVHTPEQAADFVNDIMTKLNHPLQLNEHTIHPAASIGISIYPDDGQQGEDLIRHADIAMYTAKDKGSNQWAFFKPKMTERASLRLKTEGALHKAVTNNEFILYFQPKFDLTTAKIIGCEALIRWKKNGRVVMPTSFIQVAEETGIIIPIGRWVIEETCRIIKHWQQTYHCSIPMAVNVSTQQFEDDNLLNDVNILVKKYQIEPHLLEIEVTETSLMNDIDVAIYKLQQLKKAGFSIALDDFGTGYSSLAYLRHLPISTLKIDRQFVTDLPKNNALASTILMLGRELNLHIVAEGIENNEQFQWLKTNGCHTGQGYYFNQPLSQEEFEVVYIKQGAIR
ncbi:EAL domain-containing protein [uncultured Shewanella sp.]|uniref:bifunctional diguanylate cyclase/phosphodiesterase n=1 Tax=uncultured Shewanella sp. TaxID=173975 RepID=UPI002631694C|nr:EAL domain-containing protein [uncultured Shewanella sp.]